MADSDENDRRFQAVVAMIGALFLIVWLIWLFRLIMRT
jgi:flagellar biogenesis protein FliO